LSNEQLNNPHEKTIFRFLKIVHECNVGYGNCNAFWSFGFP